MEWDDLKHFLAVARTGSLSEAARVLKTSAATVGRRVAVLEDRLGARLFDRAQTGYALTESGEAIRLKAEEVEEAILSVEREAFGRDLRVTGKVRVATAEDIGGFIIAPKLAEFRRSYPGIVLEMVSSWDVVNLTRREADIAVRSLRPTQGDFLIRQAGVWNCALYVSKDYASQNNIKPGLNDFRNLDVITWTEESNFRGGDWFNTNARGAPVVFAAKFTPHPIRRLQGRARCSDSALPRCRPRCKSAAAAATRASEIHRSLAGRSSRPSTHRARARSARFPRRHYAQVTFEPMYFVARRPLWVTRYTGAQNPQILHVCFAPVTDQSFAATNMSLGQYWMWISRARRPH